MLRETGRLLVRRSDLKDECMYLNRDCPACRAQPALARTAVSATTRAESQSIRQLREYWRGFRSDSTFFTYVRCQSCYFIYCGTYFSDDQLQELYASMPDNTNDEDIDLLRKTQRGYQRQIASYGFCGTRVLDVGADIGLLAEAIRQHDSSVVVDAIEPNRGVHDTLQATLGSSGHVVGSWAGLPTDARYDLIAGIHVLDHLIDLNQAVQEVVGRIRPGGHIYFVTHNERSLMRRLLGRRWPPFCLQHPHLFDRRTLKRVFENAGFVDVRVRRTTNHFSLRHIARVATQLLGVPARVATVVPPLAIPLKLGNISVQGRWPG